MAQLDLLATDSGYKGINFLAAGNSLDVEFGSATTDKITLESFSAAASSLLAKDDGLKTARNNWATNTDIDVDIAGLARATTTLKTEASRLSSGLSIINTRQDWVKGMANTLTEGADKLVLADMNEEGANMLMLQTRQTLGTTALSLSAQAAQSVLRLFA
jgi:flagellin-like hook-associated protein FlgL